MRSRAAMEDIPSFWNFMPSNTLIPLSSPFLLTSQRYRFYPIPKYFCFPSLQLSFCIYSISWDIRSVLVLTDRGSWRTSILSRIGYMMNPCLGPVLEFVMRFPVSCVSTTCSVLLKIRSGDGTMPRTPLCRTCPSSSRRHLLLPSNCGRVK